MEKVTTVGLGIAKHVFQVHGVDAEGEVVVRRKLCRDGVAVSLRLCHRVLLASKPARLATIGPGF